MFVCVDLCLVCAVPPMLSIPNQLEGAYIGQDVTLECRTEAFPTSINYWTTERGDMIISGSCICTVTHIRNYPARGIDQSI
jgi:hypothetical protein